MSTTCSFASRTSFSNAANSVLCSSIRAFSTRVSSFSRQAPAHSFCQILLALFTFSHVSLALQPSNETFKDMMHDIQSMKVNRDGCDQGVLGSHFSDLLDRPMFHPPVDGSKQIGLFRLPLGYQMDASFYCKSQASWRNLVVCNCKLLILCGRFADLKLKWRIPCGPNSVITFPSVPMLKPWYWWSWPTLPLGLSWHEKRIATIGSAPFSFFH